MDKRFVAKQFNRFMQMQVQSANLDDDKAMEVADLYPAWESKKTFNVGDIFKYGVNADNETQLYKVLQAHTSQEDWTPNATPSLYKKIGFTDEGVSVWTQPLGKEDSYMKGDEVSHNGELWTSDIDYNVWEPGAYYWTRKAVS